MSEVCHVPGSHLSEYISSGRGNISSVRGQFVKREHISDKDYRIVIIPGDRSLATRDVYCGGALLPAYLCSVTSNKVTTQFVSPPNNLPAGGTGDTMKGFKINFRQLPCSS